MRTDPTFWILARASGITAYLLLTAAVVAGLVLKSRALGTRVRPPAITDAHRFLALLSLAAVGVHGVALVYDTSLPIGWTGLLVPGRIPYRPLWTGVGVVAAEATVLVYLSFSVRKLIRVRNWRRLHWLTYAIFAAVTLHGVLGGTDAGRPWLLDTYLGAVGAVVCAAAFRVLVRNARPAPRLAVVRDAPQPEPAQARAAAG